MSASPGVSSELGNVAWAFFGSSSFRSGALHEPRSATNCAAASCTRSRVDSCIRVAMTSSASGGLLATSFDQLDLFRDARRESTGITGAPPLEGADRGASFCCWQAVRSCCGFPGWTPVYPTARLVAAPSATPIANHAEDNTTRVGSR